ncbi:uncharacterized protein ARMOST_17669 [Armillaria ostoyae]|uniref:Uncharacterized protein n=1 Tax=Armillaria ostoyae TaxID=47428 RepID=A0A284RZM2_ARMOS|nr:uncharacterized protein ARMOST_17669 [Armillaria ostoyae]
MHDWPPTNCTKPSVFFIPTLPSDNLKAKDAAERIEGVAFFSTDHGCEYHPHANHQQSVKGVSDVLTAKVAPSSSVLRTSSGFSDERIQGELVYRQCRRCPQRHSVSPSSFSGSLSVHLHLHSLEPQCTKSSLPENAYFLPD